MKAAVMISDGRMQVIAARLEELGMDVMRATDTASMQAVEEAAPTLDFLLLPIRGVDGAGMVHIPGVDYPAGTILERLKPEAVLLTGLHTEYLHALDRPVFCYYDDAQVREENTALTAEGLLYYFMQVTPKSIYEYTVDIIGYGHVGRKTAELFERIGIAVRVVTDEAPEEGGIPMIAYDHWKKRETLQRHHQHSAQHGHHQNHGGAFSAGHHHHRHCQQPGGGGACGIRNAAYLCESSAGTAGAGGRAVCRRDPGGLY